MRSRLRAVTASLLLMAAATVQAAFEEGVQYVPIQPQPPIGQGDQVEVIEFFWYGCPHCRDFEPTIKRWASRQPDNVEFTLIPVMFGGTADLHAQVFYALEGMSELQRLHQKLFDTMHVENNKLKTRAAIDDFLAANGVDMAKFDEAMNSFAVAAKVNRAKALTRRYGIRGVPSIVIDGRYRSGSGFRNYEEITEMIDHVVEEVIAQRNAQDE